MSHHPRNPALAAALAVATLAAGAVRGAAAATPTISVFPLPTHTSQPAGITAGTDGDLWFAELNTNKIGHMTTGGTLIAEYPVQGSLNTEVTVGIVQGPDGNFWFVEANDNAIGRITSTGSVSLFTLPHQGSGPVDIAVGADHNLWFTEASGNRIGRITPAGAITEFTVPTSASEPLAICAGPDGNLWFTEVAGAKIGSITTAGAFKEIATPGGQVPAGIATGADGNLWFLEPDAAQVVRLTPAGTFTPFPIAGGGEPTVITAGPDGNLWFSITNSAKVVRITTAGVMTEITVPTSGATPAGITAGPDGNVWFTDFENGDVDRVDLTSASSGGCAASSTTLCIDDQPGDKRWMVAASFHSSEDGGVSGTGTAIQLQNLGVTQGGLFWFFDFDNPEMLVKVLNACAVNQSFWVFYAATTNVAFTLTVTDTKTGRSKQYQNADLTAALPVQDVSAFACTAGTDFEPGPRLGSDAAPPAPPAAAATAPVAPAAAAAEIAPAAAIPSVGCTVSSTALCIDNRFRITTTYKTAQDGGKSGSGQAISLASDSVSQGGLFWFFSATNPEMLVKVLDGCAVNNRYWVFYAATTDVGFTVTVTDNSNNHQVTFTNKDGVAAAPVQDTSALTCP
jgi:streptogramin lyase